MRHAGNKIPLTLDILGEHLLGKIRELPTANSESDRYCELLMKSDKNDIFQMLQSEDLLKQEIEKLKSLHL